MKIGINIGVDYALTWTCYKGEARPCGKCGACTERIEAFREAGVEDPLHYLIPRYQGLAEFREAGARDPLE